MRKPRSRRGLSPQPLSIGWRVGPYAGKVTARQELRPTGLGRLRLRHIRSPVRLFRCQFSHSIHSTTTYYINSVRISHGEKFEERIDIMSHKGKIARLPLAMRTTQPPSPGWRNWPGPGRLAQFGAGGPGCLEGRVRRAAGERTESVGLEGRRLRGLAGTPGYDGASEPVGGQREGVGGRLPNAVERAIDDLSGGPLRGGTGAPDGAEDAA